MYRAFGKRLFDLMLATLALGVLTPVLVLVAVLVRINLGAPVLFRQRRPGRHSRPFTILKFRTMTEERDADGELLPDSRRLTRFGRFLRSTSLDELPELLNVLCGQMSLVGPRPLTLKYLPYFSEGERRRFDLRPGITGWAQINGRNYLGWDERLACDVWYVENCSLFLDLKILCITVVKVLRRSDIHVDPKSHMPNLDEERRQRLPQHGRSQLPAADLCVPEAASVFSGAKTQEKETTP